MKKLLLIFISLLLLVALVACDNKDSSADTPCQHVSTTRMENEVAASCTLGGAYDEVEYCTLCNEVLGRENKTTDPLGHDEVNHEAKAPACEEIGWDAHVTCTRCDYNTYSELEALGHNEVKGKCSNCGLKLYSYGLKYSLNVDEGSYYYSVTGEGMCKDVDIIIPSTYMGLPVTSISSWAFDGCTALTSIVIPDGVTSIGAAAFNNCTSLTNIVIPDGVTSIGAAAFDNCTSLKSIVIPDSVTSISSMAFSSCKSLESIVIPNGVTSIGYWVFELCTSLKSVVIPDSVTSIGHGAFSYCTSLTSIDIPDSVISIGDGAFSYCISLTSINIPDGVTIIDENTFSYCTNLNSIIIPDSVTSIERHAFSGCSSLSSIIIPDSVTNIFSNAFQECTNLSDVYYAGSEAEWDEIVTGNNHKLTNATIHYNYVPEE